MKQTILVALLFLAFSCNAQKKEQKIFTYENFDTEILKYIPIKKKGVSEKDFKKGLFKLNETKTSTKSNPENLNYADYWNITMALVNLGESSDLIDISFKKAIKLNPQNICVFIKTFGNSELDIRIPETFYPFVNKCSKKSGNNNSLNLKNYSEKNKLDLKLVSLINEILSNDVKYRFEKPIDWRNKQKLLDEKNQKLIDSLHSEFNTYIGKSLVGEKFENVMWAVIQHSNTEMMAEYLPVIQKAVKEKELNVVPFKMLIDRFYGLKYGYQIFGSQSGFGFELADDKKRKEIELKYEIE